MAVTTGGKNAPNFNRKTSTVNSLGWFTRTIFTYAGDATWDWLDADSTIDDGGTDCVQSLIDRFGPSGTIIANLAHGNAIFPPGYWKAGKTVRLRLCVLVTSTGGTKDLGFEVLLMDLNTPAAITLAQNNNGNIHDFAKDGDVTKCPVFFDILVQCVSPDDSGVIYFAVSGHYIYDCNNFNSQGYNQGVSVVPVYNLGNPSDTASIYASYTSRISFSFRGSDVTNIYPLNVLIEETG